MNKQHVQMSLPEGHSMVVYYAVNGFDYQAILVSMSSVPARKWKHEHAMWKHVTPSSSNFARLSLLERPLEGPKSSIWQF